MTSELDYGPDERTSIKESFRQELHGDDDDEESLPKSRCLWLKSIPKRYILAIMAFLGCCNLYALRVNLSVAVVAMVNNHMVNINGTEIMVSDFDWSSGQQGVLLSAFFWGYTITQLPGGYLSGYVGGKVLFGGGVLCTAVLTLLTPLAADIGGLPLLIALRVVVGLFEGFSYPSMQTLWSKWAPPQERSRLTTIAISGNYAGTMISLPLSGVIADSLGWPWVFYIFGIAALIWWILWYWVVVESPVDHTTMSSAEMEYITESIGFSHMQSKGVPVPWKCILLSLPVWAITVAHFVENWGFYTLLTELPTFLKNMMNFDLSKAGVLAALPYFVMAIMIQVGGHIADLILARRWLSTTVVRKLLNCVGFIGQTIFMISAAYSPNAASAVTCLTFAVGIGGLAWAGFSVSALDIAPQFAGIVWGISNTASSIAGIIAPTIAGYLTMNQTVEEWRSVFFISATMYSIGALFYGIFASGNLQPWAEPSRTMVLDEGKINVPSGGIPGKTSTPSSEVVEYESGHDELK